MVSEMELQIRTRKFESRSDQVALAPRGHRGRVCVREADGPSEGVSDSLSENELEGRLGYLAFIKTVFESIAPASDFWGTGTPSKCYEI